MKGLRVFRGLRPVVAAVAAAIRWSAPGLVVIGMLGGAAAAVYAFVPTPTATLSKPVTVASCTSGFPLCLIQAKEGVTGWPISVTASAVTGAAGTVGANAFVSVTAPGCGGYAGQSNSDGSFSVSCPGITPGGVVTVYSSHIGAGK